MLYTPWGTGWNGKNLAPLVCFSISGPDGGVRDAVFDYIMAEASRTGNKVLLGARNKFIKVHVNSPHVHSLVEVLKSPEVRFLT